MSWHYQESFPQHESSQSSTTTPFPGNQSGFTSGSSSGQDNFAGSPSYSTQAPHNRFSQQGRNLSCDGFPYGVLHDFQNDSTSSNAMIQHNTPQSSYLHGANYNQLGKASPGQCVSDPSPESESNSLSLNRLLDLIKDDDWLLPNPPESQITKHLPRDIQDLTTASSLSLETCPSEEVHHQVAYSLQQSPAASGLQPLVTAAPPVSTCVQQQGLFFFNTDATVALAGFPLPGSPSAGLGVRHPGGERQGIEREASVSSFLSAESGTSSGALLVDIHTGVSHMDAAVNTPESVELPTERHVTLNDKSSDVEEAFIRRDFSPESSNRLGQLNNFVRSRNRRPPYVCKSCQYVSNLLSNMKVHLRNHTGEKPYTCSYCEKTFRQLSHVKNHERIHTEEKPHSCSHCGKTFRHLWSLNNHQLIHTGEKPHICQFCRKAFRQKSKLLYHKRTHTGEKPYSCPFCPKRLCSSRNLAQHKKTHR